MNTGALLSMFAVAAQASTQETTTFESTSYLTANGVTVVTFTTEDRTEFYELLYRIGKTDQWEYSIGWRSHYRLSVYVPPEVEAADPRGSETSFEQVLGSLEMKAVATAGKTDIVFTGDRVKEPFAVAKANEGLIDLQTENAPDLVVIAMIAEAVAKEYRVKNAKSLSVPRLGLSGARFEDVIDVLNRSPGFTIKMWPHLMEIIGDE